MYRLTLSSVAVFVFASGCRPACGDGETRTLIHLDPGETPRFGDEHDYDDPPGTVRRCLQVTDSGVRDTDAGASAGGRACWAPDQQEDPITLGTFVSPESGMVQCMTGPEYLWNSSPACRPNVCVGKSCTVTQMGCNVNDDCNATGIDDNCNGCIDELSGCTLAQCGTLACGGWLDVSAKFVPKPSAFTFPDGAVWEATADGLGCEDGADACTVKVASIRYFCDRHEQNPHRMMEGEVVILARDNGTCLYDKARQVWRVDGICGFQQSAAWALGQIRGCNSIPQAINVNVLDLGERLKVQVNSQESPLQGVPPILPLVQYEQGMRDTFACMARVAAEVNTFGDHTDRAGNGIPDACEPDADSDAVIDGQDNCVNTANPNQMDTDEDGIGDACCESDDPDGDRINNCDLVKGSTQIGAPPQGLGSRYSGFDAGITYPGKAQCYDGVRYCVPEYNHEYHGVEAVEAVVQQGLRGQVPDMNPIQVDGADCAIAQCWDLENRFARAGSPAWTPAIWNACLDAMPGCTRGAEIASITGPPEDRDLFPDLDSLAAVGRLVQAAVQHPADTALNVVRAANEYRQANYRFGLDAEEVVYVMEGYAFREDCKKNEQYRVILDGVPRKGQIDIRCLGADRLLPEVVEVKAWRTFTAIIERGTAAKRREMRAGLHDQFRRLDKMRERDYGHRSIFRYTFMFAPPPSAARILLGLDPEFPLAPGQPLRAKFPGDNEGNPPDVVPPPVAPAPGAQPPNGALEYQRVWIGNRIMDIFVAPIPDGNLPDFGIVGVLDDGIWVRCTTDPLMGDVFNPWCRDGRVVYGDPADITVTAGGKLYTNPAVVDEWLELYYALCLTDRVQCTDQWSFMYDSLQGLGGGG